MIYLYEKLHLLVEPTVFLSKIKIFLIISLASLDNLSITLTRLF